MPDVQRRRISIAGLAGLWDYYERTYNSAGAADAVKVVDANPARYTLGFSLLSAGTLDRVSTKPTSAAVQGIALVVGVFQQLTVQVWGPLVFSAWYFSAAAGPWRLTVFELEQTS